MFQLLIPPLAPDYNQILAWHGKEGKSLFQKGIDALNVLAPDQVHLGLNAGEQPNVAFTDSNNTIKHWFKGVHPAGNPGVQLHHVRPGLMIKYGLFILMM